MSSAKPISMTSTQAQTPISPDLRNSIYAALLSGTGIRNIEGTLEHELQASGWTANLKAYITHLLRSGECTTLDEINARILEKAKLGSGGEKSNGVTNGVNGVNGHKDDDEYQLQLPEQAIREGVRVVRRELDKICDITVDGDDK